MRISDWSSDVCSSDLQSGLVSKGFKRNKSALADLTYPPLNVLKQVCRDIWIVDGPLIGFGALGISLPFPTRMTIVRPEGGLFLHSPTVLRPMPCAAISEPGTPQWSIRPQDGRGAGGGK